MHALYVFSVFLHILAATVWVGGSVFLVLVVVPTLKKPHWRPHMARLIKESGARFRNVGWASLAVLVVTGIINLWVSGKYTWLSHDSLNSNPLAHALWTKLLLVGIILTLSLLHDLWLGPAASEAWENDPQSDSARHYRTAARWIGRINLLLSFAVIFLGVSLVRGLP